MQEFLGDIARIRSKLIERLGVDQENEIHSVITHELIGLRRAKFDLLATHKERAYGLLQDVLRELRN